MITVFVLLMLISGLLCVVVAVEGQKEKDIRWMQGCCFIAFLIICLNIFLFGNILQQQYDQGQKDALNGKQKFHKVMVEQIQMIEKKK